MENADDIKLIMWGEGCFGSDDDEKEIKFKNNYEKRKEEDDKFIQGVLDLFVYEEKKKENPQKENDELCMIKTLPEEILISIFTYLPVYTIFKLQFVCTLFNYIINKFLFKYRFNYIYKKNMKKIYKYFLGFNKI